MKINALENLILTQLGNKNNQKSQNVSVQQAYPTPEVNGNTAMATQKQEVHDVIKIPNERYINNNSSMQRPTIATVNNTKSAVKTEENKAAAAAVFNSRPRVNGNVEDLLRSFVEGKDFIKLPQGQKVLLKTACYKIINFYNMRVTIDLIDKKIEPSSDFIAYTVSVKLVNEEGSVMFEALASANSLEKRFKTGGIANDSTVIVMAQSRGLRTCARWLLHIQ